MMETLAPLHVVDWRVMAAVSAILAYALLCYLSYRSAHFAGVATKPRGTTPAPRGEHIRADTTRTLWLIYASQTGQAEAIAHHSARALSTAGVPVNVRRLDQPWLDEIGDSAQLLFIVSTYGEGDAPDHASAFVRKQLSRSPNPALRGLRYGLLALGDRSYPNFCAFGRRLDQWLQEGGARPAFPRIDADRLDAHSMARWQEALRDCGAPTPLSTQPVPADYAEWYFSGRRCLNPGSPGAPLYEIILAPRSGALPAWQAGDLVDILPPGAAGHARCYSIASLPQDGRLELIVRTCMAPDGRSGLVSGWLNQHAQHNDKLLLRLRRNPGFNLECGTDTPLILIGAGAGLAGLRAHLKARALAMAKAGHGAPARSAWLLYGERSARHDRPCEAEFSNWLREGVLSRLNLSFSRDEPLKPYVQHLLLEQAQEVQAWVEHGAHILICGSAGGMARGVDEALHSILGPAGVDALKESGRIQRDVF